MTRIFLTLTVLGTTLLGVAFFLGLDIQDPRAPDPETQASVNYHFLTASAALVFACLVHAIVLTYFMGTVRWMEETSQTYLLSDHWKDESRTLKFRTIAAMTACILLLVITGAFGAAADPASPVGFQGWFGVSAGTIHLLIASTTVVINLFVNLQEYQALKRNGRLVDEVLQEVRRMRQERGLSV